jgi:hypothetical protein
MLNGNVTRSSLFHDAATERCARTLVMARLLTRFGRLLCVLGELRIAYPVGRAGVRFDALLPVAVLSEIDVTALRHFVVQDDSGNRYPAIIDPIAATHDEQNAFVAITGIVVAGG